MKQQDIAVSIKNVSKQFMLPHEKKSSLKSIFAGMLKPSGKATKQQALKDISFDIKKGEFFGIVGRNGSGKSTLLKIIAGIYQPTKGSVKINGKLVPFIELGVGFNPELTGRENVYLNGSILGFSTKEINANYQTIVDFAELEDFMDQKLKNYSSGMQVRLAFACATMANADVLLIDEVLAVGDADFQRKCFNYFKKLKKDGTTVIFITHDMNAVREYCDRGILIDDGKVQLIGTTEEIAELYTKMFNENGIAKDDSSENKTNRWGSKQLEFTTNPKVTIDKDYINVSLKMISKDKSIRPVIGISIEDNSGRVIVGTNTKIQHFSLANIEEKSQIEFKIPNIFSTGRYTVTLAIHNQDGVTVYDWWNNCISFNIENKYTTPFIISPRCEISIN